MKLLLIIIIVLSFISIGVIIFLTYSNRRKTYNCLIEFCNTCLLEIKFNKKCFRKIIDENFSCYTFEVKRLLNCYNNSQIYCSKLFNKEDTLLLQNFISSLGKKDVDCEISNLTRYKNLFENKYKISKDDESKKGYLSLKLFIAIGLLVGIILI